MLQTAQMELFDERRTSRRAVAPRQMAQPAQDIFPHGHGREKCIVLKQQSDPAHLRRQINARIGVKQYPPVEHNTAAVGALHARNAFERHGFSRSGCAEQRDSFVFCAEVHLEREGFELFDKRTFKHGFAPVSAFFRAN